jgi:hypothetical protein
VLDWLPVSAGAGDMLKSENLSGLASYPTARTNLGLGTTDSPTFKNLVIATGSIATSAPVTISQTWAGTGSTVFTALKVVATDTASGATSNLLELWSGSTAALKLSVRKGGQILGVGGSSSVPTYSFAGDATTGIYSTNSGQIYFVGGGLVYAKFAGGLTQAADQPIRWAATIDAAGDVFLFRDGPNTLALRNGAAAQTFNVYGTYTSGSAYARLAIACDTSGNATLTTQSTGTAGTVSINGVPVGLGKGNISSNVAVGTGALNTNATGTDNVAVGFEALGLGTGPFESVAVGWRAAKGASFRHVSIGYGANQLGANDSVSIGWASMFNLVSGSLNVAVGRSAGYFISGGSTSMTSCTKSLFLGCDTKALGQGQENQIVIGHDAIGLGSNTAVLGNASITTTALRGNVGIGTTAPSSKLHVVGDAVLTGQLLGGDYTVGTVATATQANVAITNNHTGQTNSSVVITPKGTGAFILGPKPDGTAVGGNARGNYAVDHQLDRSANSDVASGPNSCIGGGQRNVASGAYAVVAGGQVGTASGSNTFIGSGLGNFAAAAQTVVVGGQSNTASAAFGFIVGGTQGLADRNAIYAHAAGRFAATGDAQKTTAVFRNKTTTNSAVELFLDGAVARYTVTSGKVISMMINITGTKSDGTAVAHYLRQYSIKNVGGTTSQVYAPVTIGTDNAAGTSIALSADDTNDSLKIEVTGVTSETWRWVASVDAVEVGYGV